MYQYEGNSYGGSVLVPPLPPRPPQPAPPQQNPQSRLPPPFPPQPSLPPRPQIPPQQPQGMPYLPPQQPQGMPSPYSAPPVPQRPSAVPQRRNTPTSTPPPMPARPILQDQSYQGVLQTHDALGVGAVGEAAGSLAWKGTTGLLHGTAKVFTVFKEDAINNFSDPAPPPVDEEERRKKKELEKREEEYVKDVRRKALEKKKLKEAMAPSPSSSPTRTEPTTEHLPSASPLLPQRPGQQLLNFTLTGYANRTHDKDVFTMYSIDVRWGSTTWTIYRRYSQFHDMNKKLKGDGIVLRAPLPPKQAFGNLDKSFLQQRQEGLRRYLEGLIQQQEDILATPKRKKILMKFFAPTQMGDLHPPVLPFDVADIL